jgi:hypothetical protein
MNEIFILIVIYAAHLVASLIFYKKVVLVKGALMYLYLIGYLVITYLYFELINVGHRALRDAGYYLDFGHASIMLLIVFFLSCLTAVVFVVLVVVKFYRMTGIKYSKRI